MAYDFENFHDRLTALVAAAIERQAERVAKARQERPELAGKSNDEIIKILLAEDYAERQRGD